jgi:KipI family sensor histidine kinase inhibitor
MTQELAMPPTVAPLGDRALTITIGDRVDPEIARRVRDLAGRIRGARLEGVQEVVIGYAALSVWYDALHVDHATMALALQPLLLDDARSPGAGESLAPPRDHLIPVTYDGPDLPDVAARTGLTVADVVARHSGRWYDVYLLGFVPGWAYLGELDPALVVPRRDEPRLRVSPGSVAIAGAQTGVYPIATPGGWHLIGRTTAVLFDPVAEPPATLAPGDRVRFVPLEAAE